MDELMGATEKMIPREIPQVDPSRAALVQELLAEVCEARTHWGKDFKRMRANMKFASGKQWPSQAEDDPRYVANITQRVLKTSVSSLYAKNPTVVATRRRKLDYKVWDGKPETAMIAQQTVQAAQAGMIDPEMAQLAVAGAMEILFDIQAGTQRRHMQQRIADTLIMVINYYIDECSPGFKLQMKNLVRRARTTGVGYIKLGFQREMDLSEKQSAEIKDFAERLAAIGRMRADLTDGEADPLGPETERLRLAIEAIKSEPEVIIREGILWNFPQATRIIPSISTEKLMGWIGTEWIAEEIMLTPNRVKEVYGVDLGQSFQAYKATRGAPQSTAHRKTDKKENGLACVLEFYDKRTGLVCVMAEGYPDFLVEPSSPKIFIEQFFPYFAVTFNDIESEDEVFPKSDVELLKHIQMEYNRKKEAERQHRIANRPLYAAAAGAFEEEEQKSLAGHQAHDVIVLNGLEKGRPVSDLLQPVQKIGVDPNLYETMSTFQDMQRVTGNQEANLGGTGSSTATESNIAEGTRQGTLNLDADDLDEMLTAVMRAAGQVALTELSAETVTEIVGPGAVWPQLSRAEIAKEMWLEIKAGSSGRPNQARDAATFERIYPLLLQIPGINPRWLAERAIRIADDDVSIEDAIAEGMPAIMAQNRMAQTSTGDPESDPNQQGDEGGDKDRPGKPGGTAQPEFPGGQTGGALQ